LLVAWVLSTATLCGGFLSLCREGLHTFSSLPLQVPDIHSVSESCQDLMSTSWSVSPLLWSWSGTPGSCQEVTGPVQGPPGPRLLLGVALGGCYTKSQQEKVQSFWRTQTEPHLVAQVGDKDSLPWQGITPARKNQEHPEAGGVRGWGDTRGQPS
jgi:hypothetical protein